VRVGGKQIMRIDSRVLNLTLFVFGALVFAFTLSLISVGDTSTLFRAMTAGTDRAFQPLQMTDGAGLGILGLALGAAITLGVAGLGASLGMGTASAAALGAITEKPETFGKSILYVVFIEAVAIYGFVIAFLLVGYIPDLIG